MRSGAGDDDENEKQAIWKEIGKVPVIALVIKRHLLPENDDDKSGCKAKGSRREHWLISEERNKEKMNRKKKK